MIYAHPSGCRYVIVCTTVDAEWVIDGHDDGAEAHARLNTWRWRSEREWDGALTFKLVDTCDKDTWEAVHGESAPCSVCGLPRLAGAMGWNEMLCGRCNGKITTYEEFQKLSAAFLAARKSA